MAFAGLTNATPATAQSPSSGLSLGAQKAGPEAKVTCPKGRDQKLQRNSVGEGLPPVGGGGEGGSQLDAKDEDASRKCVKRKRSCKRPTEDSGCRCLTPSCPPFSSDHEGQEGQGPGLGLSQQQPH